MNQDINNNQINSTAQPYQNGNNSIPQQPVQPNYGVPQQPYYQQPQTVVPNYGYNNYVPPVNNKPKKKLLLPICIIVGLIILGVAIAIILGNSNQKQTRTVMIYMVGSDLESGMGLATADLEAIKYNPDVKVVLIVGGATKWRNDYIDKSETSIFELKKDGFVKVKQQSVQNMGDYRVLSDFLNYAYSNYKSDKYELILWNHGMGIMGSEFDDLSGDNLSLKDIQMALKGSPFNKHNKLELVIFRTCLNGTIEIASTFADYADYLVASEETTYGARYTNVLSFINNINARHKALDVSKQYVESYKRQMNEIKQASARFGQTDSIYSTYSIIDLSKVGNIKTALNDFFSDIDSISNFNTISRVRANLYQYGIDVPELNMVDLYNLVTELRDLSPKKADKLLSTIDDAIIYNWATDSSSRGLSIYFPYRGRDSYKAKFISEYTDYAGLEGYQTFISDFYKMQKSDYKKQSYSTNAVSFNASSTGEEETADFTLELTDEQLETFATAHYHVFRSNGNGYYKIIYMNGRATLDGNKLVANIRDKQLRVVDKNDSTNGYILVSNEVDNNDKYIIYETGVTLDSFKGEIVDWLMDRATMTIVYDKATKNISISKVVYDSGELVGSAVIDINEYDNVEFSVTSGWQITDDQGNYIGPTDEEGNARSDGIFIGWEAAPDEFKFELEPFDEGYDYYGVFIIEDTHNNYSYSKLVKMN